ncbi:MAG: DUF2147 domain-containing protein [Burkholderiales bacterium]|nr:DUF2147 domain-containing protein [Burkholderiales bacterium]
MKLAFALSAALAALAVSGGAAAQTPVGLWKTIDDSTGKEKSYVRITESNGVVTGKVEKILDPSKADQKCDECSDDRKGKPVVGMTIIRNVKKQDGNWGGGDILDPNNGKVYSVRITPSSDNKKLDVKGYIGAPILGRTQTWLRLE